MTAFGAALHVERALPDDTGVLEAFLDRIVPAPRGFTQFCVPLAPRRERPRAYHKDALMARLRAGELFSFLVETPAHTPDDESVSIGVHLQPMAPRCGCSISLAVGSSILTRRAPQELVDAVVELGDALTPCAGVVFTSETAILAHCLATGGGVGSLTPVQQRRVSEMNHVLHCLGDKARGPEWGTFLSPAHVRTLGGAGRIGAESGCDLVSDLAGGGMYLQLTAAMPAFADAEHVARLATLASFLAPIVLEPPRL